MKNYEEVLQFLYNRLPMYQRVGGMAYKAGLDTTYRLDHQFNHPHRNYATVHIAGTNGKGSVAHQIAAFLQQGGYKTGLYTSPHLRDYRERIRINGTPVPKEEVMYFVEHNKPLIDALKPSFFELSVALAFDYFARQEVDIAVIETGMGGRLDSTNILQPLFGIITNISLDHTAFLGNSLQAIAGEKAGIIKWQTPVVIGQTQPETAPVFGEYATEKEAPLFFADREFQLLPEGHSEGLQHFSVEGHQTITTLSLDLTGAYQQYNLPAVIKAFDLLNTLGYPVSTADFQKGLRQVTTLTGMLGRWQQLHSKPRVIADIGHNAAGLRMNMQWLQQIPHRRLHLVFGTVNDKNPVDLLRVLPENARFYYVQPRVPRAMDVHTLARQAEQVNRKGKVIPDVQTAYKTALQEAAPEDVIYIGGSTFVVAEVV